MKKKLKKTAKFIKKKPLKLIKLEDNNSEFYNKFLKLNSKKIKNLFGINYLYIRLQPKDDDFNLSFKQNIDINSKKNFNLFSIKFKKILLKKLFLFFKNKNNFILKKQQPFVIKNKYSWFKSLNNKKHLSFYTYLFKKINMKLEQKQSSFFKSELINISMGQFINLNAFLGNKAKNWNINLSYFSLGIRHDYIIINLEFTKFHFRTALLFLMKLSSIPRSLIFLVSHAYKYENQLRKFYKKVKQAYFNSFWIPGLISNYKKHCLFFYKKIKFSQFRSKYYFNLKKRQNFLSSITNIFKFKRIPNAVFAFNTASLAIREAESVKIPSIGFLDMDRFFTKIDYPIIINDDSNFAVTFYTRLLKYTIILGKIKFIKLFFKFYKNSFDTSKLINFYLLKILNKF